MLTPRRKHKWIMFQKYLYFKKYMCRSRIFFPQKAGGGCEGVRRLFDFAGGGGWGGPEAYNFVNF